MLLTLGTSKSRGGITAREHTLCCPGWCHPDANLFRRLEQRLRVLTPAAQVTAGRSWTVRTPASEDSKTAVVK